MKLSPCSGGKPQNVENGIGCGTLGLLPDPFLDASQPLGCLMDIVALDDIGHRLDQLVETFVAVARRRVTRRVGTASRHPDDGARSIDQSHPVASLYGFSAPAETPAPLLAHRRVSG